MTGCVCVGLVTTTGAPQSKNGRLCLLWFNRSQGGNKRSEQKNLAIMQ